MAPISPAGVLALLIAMLGAIAASMQALWVLNWRLHGWCRVAVENMARPDQSGESGVLLLLAPAGFTGPRPKPFAPLLDELGRVVFERPAVRRVSLSQASADPETQCGAGPKQRVASLHLPARQGWPIRLRRLWPGSGGFAGCGKARFARAQARLQVLWGTNRPDSATAAERGSHGPAGRTRVDGARGLRSPFPIWIRPNQVAASWEPEAGHCQGEQKRSSCSHQSRESA